jgi:hypothetical protein
MRKFPKLHYPNDPETDGVLGGEVVVTEKLDGANFRFTWSAPGDGEGQKSRPDSTTRDEWDEGGLVVGTRNHTYDHDDENLPKAFEHAVEYVGQMVDEANAAWLDTYADGSWTFFGEAMHLHSLDYEHINWHQPQKGSPHVPLEADKPNVVLFDAWHDGEWVHWSDFDEAVRSGPFTCTPVLRRGEGDFVLGEGIDIPEQSMFGGPPEGVVVRRVDGSVRAKKVSEDFREKDTSSFNNPTKAQSDAAEFVAAFVTPQRIENVARKLVDEGHYDHLRMEMMEDLPREVLVDVLAEEAWSSLLSDGGFEAEWDDDFKAEVRSKASRVCARTLKNLCQEF